MQIQAQQISDNRGAGASDQQPCETHLAFNLSIYEEDAEGDREQQQPVTLIGYTQSISTDALTLVGPFYHFGYRYLMGRDRALQISLSLPTGTINIQGFPVRYSKITDDLIDDGYMLTGPNIPSFGKADLNCLIEVGIVVMSAGDRAKYVQYLGQLDAPPEVEVKVLPAILESQPKKKNKAKLYVPTPQAKALVA